MGSPESCRLQLALANKLEAPSSPICTSLIFCGYDPKQEPHGIFFMISRLDPFLYGCEAAAYEPFTASFRRIDSSDGFDFIAGTCREQELVVRAVGL